MTEVKAPKNGYVYVYFSNESVTPVYFDDFSVSHNRSALIGEDHYYSFGLRIAAISSKAVATSLNSKLPTYGYQGAFAEEVTDFELNYNEFELRTYDPQIGRWKGADPYDEFASPYVGMGNDPINLNDPTGGFTGLLAGATQLGKSAFMAVAGAMVGGGVAAIAGGDENAILKGAVAGAALGLGGSFMGGSTLQVATQMASAFAISGSVLSLSQPSPRSVSVQQSVAGNIVSNSSGGPNPSENISFELLSGISYVSEISTGNTFFDLDINKLGKISFKSLWSSYTKVIHIDPKTKKDAFDNHCAINVSQAILSSNISMKNYKGVQCDAVVKKLPKDHKKHALGATQLADWFVQQAKNATIDGLSNGVVLTGKTFNSYIAGKKGIIYFEDYWQRPGETGDVRTGDHIDLWNGSKYGSLSGARSWWRTNFPRLTEYFTDLSNLERSKKVIFWEIR